MQNEVKEAKASAEIASEALALGYLREVVQPTVDKTGSLSSDLAPILVNARYRIVAVLPLKDALVSSYSKYLAANKVDKPDIWAARDVKLAPGKAQRAGAHRDLGQRRRHGAVRQRRSSRTPTASRR